MFSLGDDKVFSVSPRFLHSKHFKCRNNNEEFVFHHNLKNQAPELCFMDFFSFWPHLPNTHCIMVNMEDILLWNARCKQSKDCERRVSSKGKPSINCGRRCMTCRSPQNKWGVKTVGSWEYSNPSIAKTNSWRKLLAKMTGDFLKCHN